jgi:hypothetical protein
MGVAPSQLTPGTVPVANNVLEGIGAENRLPKAVMLLHLSILNFSIMPETGRAPASGKLPSQE